MTDFSLSRNTTAEASNSSMDAQKESSNMLVDVMAVIHASASVVSATALALLTCPIVVFCNVWWRYRSARLRQKKEEESVERLIEVIWGWDDDEEKVTVPSSTLCKAIAFSPDLDAASVKLPSISEAPPTACQPDGTHTSISRIIATASRSRGLRT
jgi:hypothetical protein